MWLRNGARLVLVPDSMPDTITRCLKDGWVETTDPRTETVVEPQPLPPVVPEPVLEPEGAPADAPASEPEPKAKRG